MLFIGCVGLAPFNVCVWSLSPWLLLRTSLTLCPVQSTSRALAFDCWCLKTLRWHPRVHVFSVAVYASVADSSYYV